MTSAHFTSVDTPVRDAAIALRSRAANSTLAEFALVHGTVAHTRHRPTVNAFEYPAFCLRLPLSRLASLDACGLAYNRCGAVSFHDRDHGPRDGRPLLPWIRDMLAAEGIDADGEVVLYAFPRMLGYVFNPVSFWVCHDRTGAVRAVLCEVRNTFGEHHNYLLAHPDRRPLASGESMHARKVFHISPFCAVQGHYVFRFHFGGERWLARIDYHDDDCCSEEPLLATRISGRAAPLDGVAVRGLLWRYRFFTLGVIARIHWQAVKLWLKGVRYFTKPSTPTESTSR